MPMEFERIINEYLSLPGTIPSTQIYDIVKCQISQTIQAGLLPYDAIHYDLTSINANAILTTNYDLLLERAFSSGVYHSKVALNNNTLYLHKPTDQLYGVFFYHIHGTALAPKTLCLGYEHYSGLIEKLRYNLNRKEQKNQRMIIEQVLSGTRPKDNTWGERFYTSNVAILGLGLPQCEIDLWWILTHRASLYYSDYAGLKTKIKNQIDYYDVFDDREYIEGLNGNKEGSEFPGEDSILTKQGRKEYAYKKYYKYPLLEKFHVNVKLYYLSDYYEKYHEDEKIAVRKAYRKAYQSAIEDIKKAYNRSIQ